MILEEFSAKGVYCLLALFFVFCASCDLIDRIMHAGKHRHRPPQSVSRWDCEELGLPHIMEISYPPALYPKDQICQCCGKRIFSEKINISHLN